MSATEPQAATYTCDMDGYTEDSDGRESYWHCEEPSVAVLPDGTQCCSAHVLDAMERQS